MAPNLSLQFSVAYSTTGAQTLGNNLMGDDDVIRLDRDDAGLGVLMCDESPPYSFSLMVQRRDRSVSQLNCRARTLLSVLTPPAIVRHFPVCTFLIW